MHSEIGESLSSHFVNGQKEVCRSGGIASEPVTELGPPENRKRQTLSACFLLCLRMGLPPLIQKGELSVGLI